MRKEKGVSTGIESFQTPLSKKERKKSLIDYFIVEG